jgi:hypothetical protein
MMVPFMDSALIVGAVIPLVWSGALAAARGAGRPGQQRKIATERIEQIMLLLMIAPALIGLCLIGTAEFFPDAVSALPPPVRITISQSRGLAAHGPEQGLDWTALVWLLPTLLYLVGMLRLTARFVAARLRLRQILDRATDASATWGNGVSITLDDVPPFASGRSRIILPHALVQKLSPTQTMLVVRHERAHLRRRDPARFLAFALVEIAFWFNPMVRRQIERCRLAAELACDTEAMQADPGLRKAYAQSLVLALTHAATDAMFCAAAASPTGPTGDYHMRIAEIMRPSGPNGRRPLRTPFVLGLLLAGPVALLQAGFAGALVPYANPKPGLLLSSASFLADRMEVIGNQTLILDGNASVHQSGVDVRAGRITLTAGSTADYASGRFESLLAEGSAEVRISQAGQNMLGGTVNLSADHIDRNASGSVFRGDVVKMGLRSNQ